MKCRVRAGGVLAMRLGKVAIFGVALMAVSTAAAAFQEQQGASAPAQQPAAQAQQKPAVEFSVPEANKGVAGTEVRIPGLGKLGVLPKMDFGLELLYGAASDGKAQDTPSNVTDEGDLRIQGTVKHRF